MARRSAPAPRAEKKPAARPPTPPKESVAPAPTAPQPSATDSPGNGAGTTEILAEVKRVKKFFHGTVVAQAQRIDLDGDKLVFAFTPGQRTLASQLRQNRGWLEQMASRVVGRPIVVATAQAESAAEPPSKPSASEPTEEDRLREQAMTDPVVQSMLEVFPAKIGDVEKLE